MVRFDFLALVLYDAAGDTTRLHILESSGLRPDQWFTPLPVEETPSGMVMRTQQPLILSGQDQMARWPRLLERVEPFGVNSLCLFPLTTARCSLGVLGPFHTRQGY